MFRRFCKLFSESSTGRWAIMQLPCCPSKEGELSERILQNLRNKWPPHPVGAAMNKLTGRRECVAVGVGRLPSQNPHKDENDGDKNDEGDPKYDVEGDVVDAGCW